MSTTDTPHTPGTEYSRATPGPDESTGFAGEHGPAQPTDDDRAWAAVAHGGGLAGVLTSGLMGVVAPLVVLLARGGRSPYVRRHAVSALNFQLTLLTVAILGAVGGLVVTVLTLGLALIVLLPAAAAYFVFAIVVMVVATLRSATGEDYDYPLSIPFVQ